MSVETQGNDAGVRDIDVVNSGAGEGLQGRGGGGSNTQPPPPAGIGGGGGSGGAPANQAPAW